MPTITDISSPVLTSRSRSSWQWHLYPIGRDYRQTSPLPLISQDLPIRKCVLSTALLALYDILWYGENTGEYGAVGVTKKMFIEISRDTVYAIAAIYANSSSAPPSAVLPVMGLTLSISKLSNPQSRQASSGGPANSGLETV